MHKVREDSIVEKVFNICQKHPECSHNYNKLIFEFWREYDPELITPVLSITRGCQKLHQLGRI